MSEWQPIETAPRDGTSVLLYGDREMSVASWDARTKEWRGEVDGAYVYTYMSDISEQYAEVELPTHWMPLPEPPKG